MRMNCLASSITAALMDDRSADKLNRAQAIVAGWLTCLFQRSFSAAVARVVTEAPCFALLEAMCCSSVFICDHTSKSVAASRWITSVAA